MEGFIFMLLLVGLAFFFGYLWESTKSKYDEDE
jgi:hypothetical protein